MPPINASTVKSGEYDTLPLANTGSLEGFIKYLGILASSPESQFAATVLGEITQQREQIQSQDDELKENKIIIKGMFKANQDEISKQQDSALQIELLRATVHEKEIEIAEYSRKLGSLQQEMVNLKATCSQEAAKVSQSVKDITILQNNLKEKDKMIDQMKTAGSKLKLILSSEQKKSKELEDANTSMRTELQAIRDRIQKMEDFTVQCSDIDDDYVTTEFKSLWTCATRELSPLMEQDVPENILKEKTIWEKLRKGEIVLPPNFPLIPSNSSAAKAIRFALILAVLFREINQRVFQPSYFLSETDNLRETLEHLAVSNGEKEALCRRMLLLIDPDAERSALKSEIGAIAQKMLSYAGGLLTVSQQDLFCTKIKEIVQTAAEAWLPIQRSRQKFATDFDQSFDPDDSEWDRFPLAGENTTPAAQELQGLYILNIFPCISSLEDGDYDPLTKIIQLRSSQALYLAAQQEAAQIASCAPARRSSNRPRRQSTAGSNGTHFLGGSSAKA